MNDGRFRTYQGSHLAFRNSVRALLPAAGFDVIGEAAGGMEAIQAVNALRPEVFVQPSGPSPWSEYGSRSGKNQRFPLNTSSTLGIPSRLRVVIRHFPSFMSAHSAIWCQCSSRMAPGSRYVFTPAISSEIAKSACVTSRAHPPRCWRWGEILNEDQKNGCVLGG